MTYTEDKQRIKRRRKKDLPAVIVAVNGSVYDPLILGNVWTQQRTSTGLSIPKSTLPPAGRLMTLNAGDDVYLEPFHGKLRIKEPNTGALIAKGANPNALMQKTASGQITQASIQTLALAANGSMVVTLKAWLPIVSGIAYQFGGTQDLTSAVPAAGEMCYALLAVQSDYATLEVVTSTARAVTDVPLDLADINEALALLSAGSTPAWALKLVGEQTGIKQSDIDAPMNPMDCLDLRQLVNTAGSGAGSALTVTDGITNVTNVTALSFTDGATVTDGGGGVAEIAVTGSGGTGYILIQDVETAGTNGGTFTNGAWRTRTLNTIAVDTTGVVTLGSNQFVLPAGTYRIRASAPAYNVGQHQIRLQNITDGTTTVLGEGAYTATTVETRSALSARFTIASAKTFEIQHRCQNTSATVGFGSNIGWDNSVFTTVELVKE